MSASCRPPTRVGLVCSRALHLTLLLRMLSAQAESYWHLFMKAPIRFPIIISFLVLHIEKPDDFFIFVPKHELETTRD
jgi:hypothetical protein